MTWALIQSKVNSESGRPRPCCSIRPLLMLFRLSALRTLVSALATALIVLGAVAPARAQEEPQQGNSYLTLYPPGDVYAVHVIGDGIAEGLLNGLNEAFRGDNRVQIKPKVHELGNIIKPELADQLKVLDDVIGREQPAIAVVMFGPQDRISIKGPAGKKVWMDSDEWRAEFSRQVDTIVRQFKRRGVSVYWVSLPNVRKAETNEDVQVLNEIIRERVYLNGFKYIDAYAGFADEGGGYAQQGPDLAGKIRLLRESNGVNFTEAGNRKLAHFVERELKRDLTQAKSDRTIPLAGSEAEQAGINASRLAALAVAKPAGSPAGSPGSGAPAAVDATQGAAGLTAGEQKADSGRINLAVAAQGGREEIISIDLLRPAIPPSVLAIVNRKENAEKATQLGDLLIYQVSGGLMVMSSITPATDPANPEARRRLSPTQTPYFRVMVKGERMTPRPGRADDTSWPRPEPPPVVVQPAAAPDAPPLAPAPAAAAKKPPPAAKPKRADTEPGSRTRPEQR
jgi:uncharacterized protein